MKKTLLYSIVALSLFGMVGVSEANAFSGMPKGGQKGNRLGLLTPELKESFKQERKNLSKEERQILKENRQNNQEEKRKELENFLGLSHDEIKSLKKTGLSMGEIVQKQGKSESDVRNFFTQRMSTRVNKIMETHNLTESQVTELKNRISQVIDNIITSWFKK